MRAVAAAQRADAEVAAVRDHPEARLSLVERIYHGPFGRAPRHLPFKRAAMSFMRWQADRGLLAPPSAAAPGSPWWRAVNERLLRDQCEAVARAGGLGGSPSASTIEGWSRFIVTPTAERWYAAHNASIVAAYIEHRGLAQQENEAERFFLDVVLARVLFAHALVAAPHLALGRLAPLGRVVGDPRLGGVGLFLSLGRVLPDRYPALDPVESYIDIENRVGRLLDFGVINPRMQVLYEWSARQVGRPDLQDLVRDGSPVYAWPYDRRSVWHPTEISRSVRLLSRLTAARA